jgi:hypothetical protein
MATGTLTFNLDDHEDEVAHLRAVKALDLVLVLWDMDQYLRAQYKYADKEEAYAHREKLQELLRERGISLDDLLK